MQIISNSKKLTMVFWYGILRVTSNNWSISISWEPIEITFFPSCSLYPKVVSIDTFLLSECFHIVDTIMCFSGIISCLIRGITTTLPRISKYSRWHSLHLTISNENVKLDFWKIIMTLSFPVFFRWTKVTALTKSSD